MEAFHPLVGLQQCLLNDVRGVELGLQGGGELKSSQQAEVIAVLLQGAAGLAGFRISPDLSRWRETLLWMPGSV